MSGRKSRTKKKAKLRDQVLNDVLAGLDIVGELTSLPPYAGPRHHFEYHMARKEWDRMYAKDAKKRRALKKMREKKWIEDRRKGNEIIIRISSDAAVASLKNKIMGKKEQLPEGKLVLLSFDFPNGATKARNQWRGLIRRLGLRKEQLSVYSTNFNVANELCALVKALGAERWIRIFVAHEKTVPST